MNKNKAINTLFENAVSLLKELIRVPSLSRQEDKTAGLIEQFLLQNGVVVYRSLNNVWASNKYFEPLKPTVLLNSHHDTVAPNSQFTRDPHEPMIEDGKLFGLGSTDAGGALVSLLAAFIYFHDSTELGYNIIFAATAEEEISGENGIASLFNSEIFKKGFENPNSFAIVGEPTRLDLAIAEKGLVVLDCIAYGKPGHAARNEGENAIYKAMTAIQWFRDYRFPLTSALLGEVKMSVTAISTPNKSHNIIPAECSFVVDVRVTDSYSNEEIIEIITKNIQLDVVPRSVRLRSPLMDPAHPVVQAGVRAGKNIFGSPTTSDKALIPLTTLKCGPGSSEQSHSADEFILIKDIEEGIRFYIELIGEVNREMQG
ncbi:MAG TPA: M20/M25/M40 family metallo-hydrolase [Ferruginibacter sp.]|nr:M20/M25/M40 family metallo-hydrolase [Ferruginibacter sp.]